MTTALRCKRTAIPTADGVEGVELERTGDAGRALTSYPSPRADLRNPWADVVDEEVAMHGNPIDDLPAFCQAIVEQFATAGAGAS